MRGYAGEHAGDYMEASSPEFVVAEFWDALAYRQGVALRNQVPTARPINVSSEAPDSVKHGTSLGSNPRWPSVCLFCLEGTHPVLETMHLLIQDACCCSMLRTTWRLRRQWQPVFVRPPSQYHISNCAAVCCLQKCPTPFSI